MIHIGTYAVEQESLVVLYESSTGRIVHAHGSVAVNGGAHPDTATFEKDARAAFAKAQPNFKGEVGLLHVAPGIIQPGTFYEVDTKKGALVETKLEKAKPKA
jgi:hypothetical protein